MKSDTNQRLPIAADALTNLEGLSKLMRKRRRENVALPVAKGRGVASHDDGASATGRTIIVPFVGAGASASAGLPTSQQLKESIWREVLGVKGRYDSRDADHRDPTHGKRGSATLEALFKCEARSAFGKSPSRLTDLSLFELASILSVAQYGRDAIRAAIRRSLPSGAARPLSYELIAHLAKHDYIDDIVSLNFDTLLEEALMDELPERIRVIDGSLEIPGDHSRLRAPDGLRYLLKPFGSVDVDYFRLRPDELQRYGEASVWHFMLRHVFASDDREDDVHNDRRATHGRTGADTIVLLLVGYAAAEAAFSNLVRDLRSARSVRAIKIFSINTGEPSQELDRLRRDGLIHALEWIQVDADAGMTILLQMLRSEHAKNNELAAWTPVARHEVLAACFPKYSASNTSMQRSGEASSKRFTTEIVLQAVKGRGFFTVESIADVRRIPVPPEGAGKALKRLIDRGLLQLHKGGALQRSDPKHLRADFELSERDNEKLATSFLDELGLASDTQVPNYKVYNTPHGWRVEAPMVSLKQFVSERFATIGAATQIEVSQDVSPATAWMFSSETHLRSVSALQEWTAQCLSEAMKAKYLVVTGIWVTGEWLFHEDGWAFKDFGRPLIERAKNGTAAIRVVLASFDEHMGTIRGARAEWVNALLDTVMLRASRQPTSGRAVADGGASSGGRNVSSVRYLLDWWLHNRCLTLVRWGKSHASLQENKGVYFRQRHGSPLVAPVALDAPSDCGVLDDLFNYYCQKAGSIRREATSLPADAMARTRAGNERSRPGRSTDHTHEYVAMKVPEQEPSPRDVAHPRKRRKGGEENSPTQR